MTNLYPSANTYKLLNIIENMSEAQLEQLLSFATKLVDTKREHLRKDCQVAIDYTDTQNFSKGVIQNISSGGAYVKPRGTLKVGKTVTLTFDHPVKKTTIKVDGKIVREDASGVGIAFLEPIEGLNAF